MLNRPDDLRVCAVKLNASDALAVCTIQTREGTALATRFIRGGRHLHGLRKSSLGRIAKRRAETGLIAPDEADNIRLWAKLRNLDEQAAHRVSRRIVELAQAHGATLLVFEHLIPYHPKKGSFSQRGNEKRAYWLRSKIFLYSRYKAWAEGIITCRVSPRDTVRECASCHAQVNRYRQGQENSGYSPVAPLVICAVCGMRGNADRTASLNIGQRIFARYQSKEKPHTSPRGEALERGRCSNPPGSRMRWEATF